MAAEHGGDGLGVPVPDEVYHQQRDFGALVDTKLLGKPPALEGRDGEYQDWAFVMRSYLGCVNQGFRSALKMIDTLTEENKHQLNTLGVEHSQLSMTLYHLLSMTTKDKALRIVQSVDEGHGC